MKIQELEIHIHIVQVKIIIWRYVLSSPQLTALFFEAMAGYLLHKNGEPYLQT